MKITGGELTNLTLTADDHQALVMMLAYAVASHETKEGFAPARWKEVVDWVLSQSPHEDTHLYYHEKIPFKQRKERELQEAVARQKEILNNSL